MPHRPYVPPPNGSSARPVVGIGRGETFQASDALGNLLTGVFMILTPDAYETHKGMLAVYLSNPPLARVWAGDDPEDPSMTVLVRFPNQIAADAVLAAMGN